MSDGLKDTLEVFELARQLGVQVGEILKDGKVSVFDLPKIAALWGPAKAALEGAKNIPNEVSVANLTAEKVKELVDAAMAVADAWMNAFVTKPQP